SKQWFVRMQPLAEPALTVVKNGTVKIFPQRWVNLYNHWLENVRDWCISRQLWWGHRIPVYYCDHCHDPEKPEAKTGMIVSETEPKRCPKCGSTKLRQDDDVLDTWFSSWLWPFGTLGWPEKTEDLERFYPTQTLVTGWDIIYLWVARMIMAGLEFTGSVPFSSVVFHPMVRDEKGRKMSKSLGNSPDPVELADKYGADAMRLGIQLITPREQDVLFSEKSLDVGRKFCNKLWNASRLIYMNHKDGSNELPTERSIYDEWILSEFNELLENINRYYETFELNAIARALYDFVWHVFCDWFLEFDKLTASHSARYLLKQIIIMLHPYIPHITEEIYQKFSFGKKSIMCETWPQKVALKQETDHVSLLKALIEQVRNVRGLFNISAKDKLHAWLITPQKFQKFLESDTHIKVLKKLTGFDEITFNTEPEIKVASVILPNVQCYIELTGIDIQKEKTRLTREIASLTKRIDEIKYRLNNPQYVTKASEMVKKREAERLENFLKKKESISKAVEKL
ncbi:MAG: class I tRNA ligase family protein, partial [candidate division WOR-3 bacterium]